MSGDYATAERYFAQALELIEKVLGADHPDHAKASRNLERTREKLRAADRAEGATGPESAESE